MLEKMTGNTSRKKGQFEEREREVQRVRVSVWQQSVQAMYRLVLFAFAREKEKQIKKTGHLAIINIEKVSDITG